MDFVMNSNYLVRALVINSAFITSLGLLFTVIIRLMLKPEERRGAIGAMWSVLLIAGFTWLWGTAYLGFPAIDELISNVFGPVASASAAASRPSHQEAAAAVTETVPEEAAKEEAADEETEPTPEKEDEDSGSDSSEDEDKDNGKEGGGWRLPPWER